MGGGLSPYTLAAVLLGLATTAKDDTLLLQRSLMRRSRNSYDELEMESDEEVEEGQGRGAGGRRGDGSLREWRMEDRRRRNENEEEEKEEEVGACDHSAGESVHSVTHPPSVHFVTHPPSSPAPSSTDPLPEDPKTDNADLAVMWR